MNRIDQLIIILEKKEKEADRLQLEIKKKTAEANRLLSELKSIDQELRGLHARRNQSGFHKPGRLDWT